MSFDPISAAFNIGGKLIDRLWPDPAQRDAAKLELLKMQQDGELKAMMADVELAKGQLEINKAEADNPNVFVSGWRPGAGWVCVAALFSQFIVRPFFEFGAHLAGYNVTYPNLETGDLMTLLLGMLGLGAMRMQEKIRGVATK